MQAFAHDHRRPARRFFRFASSRTTKKVAAAAAALAEAGGAVAQPNWLAPGEACEIGFDGLSLTDGRAAVQSRLQGAALDVCATPAA